MELNLKKTTNLNKLKKTLIISFWIVFPAYMIFKFYFKDIADFYLDFLIIATCVFYVALYSVKSIISYREDRRFYKKISWLITIYLGGSLITYFLYFEIFEDMPSLIKNNMYLSIALFLFYVIFLKLRKN